MPDNESRILLRVEQCGPLPFRCQNGAEKGRRLNLSSLRIYCQLWISANERWLAAGDAVIDTGAPFAIFPHEVWKDFSSSIRWLAPKSDDARSATRVTSFGSVPLAAQMGLIDIRYGEENGDWSQRTTIAAKFLEANAQRRKRPVVLGLTAIQHRGDHPELSNAYVNNSFLVTPLETGPSASLFEGSVADARSFIRP